MSGARYCYRPIRRPRDSFAVRRSGRHSHARPHLFAPYTSSARSRSLSPRPLPHSHSRKKKWYMIYTGSAFAARASAAAQAPPFAVSSVWDLNARGGTYREGIFHGRSDLDSVPRARLARRPARRPAPPQPPVWRTLTRAYAAEVGVGACGFLLGTKTPGWAKYALGRSGGKFQCSKRPCACAVKGSPGFEWDQSVLCRSAGGR